MNQKETIIGHVGVAVNIKKMGQRSTQKSTEACKRLYSQRKYESSLTRHDKCFIAI